MTIGVRTTDKVTVLDVSGEVDLYHSPELLAKLTELIKQKHTSILLNFQAVTYIDSSGLASAFRRRRLEELHDELLAARQGVLGQHGQR